MSIAIKPNRLIQRASVMMSGLFLVTTLVMAQNALDLKLPPPTNYDDLAPIETDDGSVWRDSSPTKESDWRSPKTSQQSGRIKYGYDPSYEEIQMRQNSLYNTNQNPSGLGDVSAPMQFRLDF